MQLKRLTGSGSTRRRKGFWNEVADVVLSLRKIAGHNMTVYEHEQSGTIIEASVRKGGTYGPPSGVTGACCHGGLCSITTEAACPGNYMGNGTTCDDVDCAHGACCHADGSCTNETADSCDGTFQGYGLLCGSPGIDCTARGACCVNGGCLDLTQTQCIADGGAYAGNGVSCVSVDCSRCCYTGFVEGHHYNGFNAEQFASCNTEHVVFLSDGVSSAVCGPHGTIHLSCSGSYSCVDSTLGSECTVTAEYTDHGGFCDWTFAPPEPPGCSCNCIVTGCTTDTFIQT